MYSAPLLKGFISYPLCYLDQKRIIIEDGTVTNRAFAFGRHSFSLRFAEVNHTNQRSSVCSGSSAVTNSERFETLLDYSNKPLDDMIMSALERELQELFDEVKKLIMTGNINDAKDLLQANYEAVKKEIDAGAKGMEEAAILDVVALGYLAIGDLKFVGSILEMLSEIVDGLKDNEPRVASVLNHMGSMYSVLKKFQKSMLVYQRALHILERAYGKNSAHLVMTLLGMAKNHVSTRSTTKAEELYHRMVSVLELNKGVESVDLVVPLSALGNLLIKEGKAKDAEIHFKRVLNIYTKLYGEKDGRTGLAMCSLANVKCAQGNASEAINLYQKALEIIEDSQYMALDDSIMEKMRTDLAELLHAVGRWKEGREILEECLLISEKFKGREHPSSVTHLLNLATSYSRSKNYVEAERLLRTGLRIVKKTAQPDDQSISFPMLHLAVTLYHLRRDEEAEQLALETLRIREKAFGKESLPVGEALDCLVSIQTRLGKDGNELLGLLKRVLKIQEREFGYESHDVMVTLKKIVFYLNKLGKKNEKLPLERRLSILNSKHKQRIQY